jgi:hypothetical protein
VDLIGPLLFGLNILALSACILAWFALFAYVGRWTTRWRAADLQARLQVWAVERGFTIIEQHRPTKAEMRGRYASAWAPMRWLISPKDVPWVYGLAWRASGICVTVLSTSVELRDRQRRRTRGLVTFVGSALWGFQLGPVECRWEEDVQDFSATREPARPDGPDPLWDRWVDS